MEANFKLLRRNIWLSRRDPIPFKNGLATTLMNMYTIYSRKYWRELNLSVGSQIAITNLLARFKLGDSVQDRHTFICMEEILADFNLAVGRPTAKLPNLNHRQVFRLWYGTHNVCTNVHVCNVHTCTCTLSN